MAAPTRNAAPADHCTREPTRRAQMVSAAPIDAHNSDTSVGQFILATSSAFRSPGGPSQRNRFACSTSATPITVAGGSSARHARGRHSSWR